jgi:LmbE family N-acetylglucosaminyl deacetylase
MVSAQAAGAPNPIDATGTDESDWRDWPGLADLPPLDLSGWRSVAVVAAHPDDEVLGVGGAIALLASAGARLRLVAVTDGEASHPGLDEAGADRLAAVRTAETLAALRELGAGGTEIRRLALPDTGVAAREDELADLLSRELAGFDVVLAPWNRDVHADHEAAGRAAARAYSGALWSYPVWAWHWARPADPRLPWARAAGVPLPEPVRARKAAAIACFRTQMEPRGPGIAPVLPDTIIDHFTRAQEVLFR